MIKKEILKGPSIFQNHAKRHKNLCLNQNPSPRHSDSLMTKNEDTFYTTMITTNTHQEVGSKFQDCPIYQDHLLALQVELVKMQQFIHNQKRRVAIVFEGRDSAGKSGAVLRFTRHMNPRHCRVVAMPKPTELENGQWFFQRYIQRLPNAGEIVFFDRSWYNRAMVEPVLGFCSKDQYRLFLKQAPNFEKMLIKDGVQIIKLWFSIDRSVQRERLNARKESILTSWKLSTVDLQAQMKWDEYTKHKLTMFEHTSHKKCPWVIVQGNDKEKARLEAIRYVLSQVPYDDKNIELLNKPIAEGIISIYSGDNTSTEGSCE